MAGIKDLETIESWINEIRLLTKPTIRIRTLIMYEYDDIIEIRGTEEDRSKT